MVSVVYESQGGSSKRYALALASRIGCGCYSLRNSGDVLGGGSEIIFVGWRSGPYITGLDTAMKDHVVIAAVCVGLEQYSDKDMDLIKNKNRIGNLFYVRGAMDRSKLNRKQKLILGIVSIKMLLFNRSPEDRMVRDVMDNGGDLSSEDQLDPVIGWYGTH